MEDLNQMLAHAIDWAHEIGRIHLTYFRGNSLNLQLKANINDVVTAADKESENYFLRQIEKTYPSHSVLGEESGIHKGHSDYEWVIDPLDGTTNFSQGLPIFSVSIGLQYQNETVLGVVYIPYFDELFTAIKGKGSFMNHQPIHVSQKTSLAPSVLTTGFPIDKDTNPDNNLAELSKILPLIRGIRRSGSAAYDLCYVGAGFLDGYWEPNLHLWDICAGMLIAQEAGALVTYYRTDREISILAAPPALHSLIEKQLLG